MPTFTEIPIDKISPHPKNIRRHAEADDEMVDSIRSHGLVQAVTVVTHDDGFWLIGGHRRLDGCRKADVDLVPAMIRDDWDTEASHIEAMAIENLHREDLTAIEEAAGYEQLALLGYSADDIAKKTGRAVTTVKSRMKLNGLHKNAKDAVHGHQITLDQASDLLDLEDRKDLLKKVEKTIGTDEFTYTLRSALSTRRVEAENARLLAECEATGLPEIPRKKDQYYWPETGPRPPRDGEVADAWAYSYRGEPTLVITKPPKRQKSAEEIANDARWKKEQENRKALEQKHADARDLRVEHVVAAGARIKIPSQLLDVIKIGLGTVLSTRQAAEIRSIAATAGVELTRDKSWRDMTLVTQINALPANGAIALLISLITHDAEQLVSRSIGQYASPDAVELQATSQYFTALEALGYTFPAIDKKARASIDKKAAAARAKADKKSDAA